jgi:uncharacterized Zn finger protein (UPF0148 family)
MSKHETLEQIAERLTIGAALRTPYEQEALILAALREVKIRSEICPECGAPLVCSYGSVRCSSRAALREAEKRGEQRAATLGGTLLDSAVERAEKAEAENARLREALTTAQVRANELAAEAKRLRDALSELLESPASFEDSRLDYAERQVDTKVWDEAKAALAPPAKEPKP